MIENELKFDSFPGLLKLNSDGKKISKTDVEETRAIFSQNPSQVTVIFFHTIPIVGRVG